MSDTKAMDQDDSSPPEKEQNNAASAEANANSAVMESGAAAAPDVGTGEQASLPAASASSITGTTSRKKRKKIKPTASLDASSDPRTAAAVASLATHSERESDGTCQ